MDPEEFLTITRRAGYVIAELNRPADGNAFVPELLDRLHAAVDAAEADPTCRALVIAAMGEHFCAGADLKALRDRLDDPVGAQQHSATFWQLLSRLSAGTVPTIALVEGPALGGGVGLLAACDVVIAGPNATFQLTEVFLGTQPTTVFPWLARRVGVHRSMRLAMLAEKLSAAQAREIGLVDFVHDEPRTEVRRILAALRRATPKTLADLKGTHNVLFPVHDYQQTALRAFGAPLDAPAVLARIDEFTAEGLL